MSVVIPSMPALLPCAMRVNVLPAAGVKWTEQQPVPEPTVGAAGGLVRIGSVGICGSHPHYYRHGRIANYAGVLYGQVRCQRV